MKHVSLSCFSDFRCIADACADTCCAGWEVDLDEDTVQKYQEIPGALGDEIRSHIVSEDGYTFFRLRKNHACPFLTERKLCRLILAGHEDWLSVTCREHPRFVEEYGSLHETCLSVSCPEAARLLLSADEPVTLVCRTDEIDAPDPDLDEFLLEDLLALRDTLYGVIFSGRPLPERLYDLRLLAEDFQYQLDSGMGSDAQRIAAEPDSHWLPDIASYLAVMQGMEFTDDRLPNLLKEVLEHLPGQETVLSRMEEFSVQANNLLFYFLYRYLLRAVWDWSPAEKVYFSIFSVFAIFTLAAAMNSDFQANLHEAAVRYSREAEHSPENLDLLFAYQYG